MAPALLWDIFCKVIDNHGDLGVCWRLSAQLASQGQRVRLWVDDPAALGWMAPRGAAGVTVLHWPAAQTCPAPGDVLVEAFGCDPAPELIAAHAERARAGGQKPVWINLEYLSAEPYVERMHGLPSPVLAGPGTGLIKHFFYPGFTPATGGLLREAGLGVRQGRFDRAGWLRGQGVSWQGERLISLFCYEPPALKALLDGLAGGAAPVQLLVTAGRASAEVGRLLGKPLRAGEQVRVGDKLVVTPMALVPQPEFDHLLWSCDLNFVRGEDSLVRALWAARTQGTVLQAVPFIWQIYPQHDDAHLPKLSAFLDWMDAPASLRALHSAWNADEPPTGPIRDMDITGWAACVQQARGRAMAQDDLATQLLRLVEKKR